MLNVVVVTYDRPIELCELLKALEKQVDPVSVIVSDDGGTSAGSIVPFFGMVEKYLWTRHTSYQRVARYNEVFEYIHHGNVVLLDDDCIPQSDLWSQAIEREMENCEVLRGLTLCAGEYNVPPWFSTINVCFKLHELKSVIGGFDSRYNGNYGYEDWDMGMKVKSKGLIAKIATDKNTAVLHIGKPRGLDASVNERLYYGKWGNA